MTVPGPVAVVSGPPGAGKSTVAALLAAAAPPAVHLPADAFWEFLVGGVSPYRPAAQRQNETVMAAVAAAATGYARGGYRVFLDAVVGPWFLGPFVTAARTTGTELLWVVLRPDEQTVVARAGARGAGALTAPGPVRAMYDQFCDLGAYEGHALDTTGESPAVTAERVRRHLARPASLLVPAAER